MDCSVRMCIPSSAPVGDTANVFSMDCILADSGKGRSKPIPRSGHRIVCDDTYIYAYGGYNPYIPASAHGMLTELWRYTISTRKWECLSESGPFEAASHSMILMGDCLLIWGGTAYPWGRYLSNRLHCFHIPSCTWVTDVPCSGDMPSPRYGQSMTLCEGKLYIIGGTTGTEYNIDVHLLTLKTMVYEKIQPVVVGVSAPRYRHEVVVLDDSLYVLGGGAADASAFNFIKIPVFHTKKQVWSKVTTHPCQSHREYPAPRKFHSAVQLGEWAYMCGGHTGNQVLDDIWRLNLRDLQWTRLAQVLPFPVYFHAAACTPAGCMFVFGGVMCEIGDRRSNLIFKMWLTVPSLQEIVWDVLTRKLGKQLRNDKQHVLHSLKISGFVVPSRFARRLQ